MLIVGSNALIDHFPELIDTRKIGDFDAICTIEQFKHWFAARKDKLGIVHAVPTQGGRYYHCRDERGFNYEFELAWPETSAAMLLEMYSAGEVGQQFVYASPLCQLLIKESHKYKRNSPHFLKTMKDIHFLREKLTMDGPFNGAFDDVSPYMQVFRLRESESYDYKHPALNVSKEDFFKGDGVNYVYDHDSIHLTVALCSYPNAGDPIPAYTYYMKDGSEVMTSREKFFGVAENVRLYGVYEESCVLALERSQIPHGLGKEGGPTPRWSFEMALMKVCTSITSGWFREYAWENYQKVLDLYEEMGEDDYIKRFNANQHLLKPFQGSAMQ